MLGVSRPRHSVSPLSLSRVMPLSDDVFILHSIATDLNLHHPNTVQPQNEQHAREILNRMRTWLNCFNLDRSYSSQYGKAPIISNTDYIASHSEFWWKSSPYNLPGFDIHLCAYNAELKLLAEYRYTIFSDPEHPVGLNKASNLSLATSSPLLVANRVQST